MSGTGVRPPHPDEPPQQRVFDEPWQAQAFALTLQLHHNGRFTWPQWSRYLAAEVAAAGTDAEASSDGYYRLWLAALEKILIDTGCIGADEHAERQRQWDHAARHTPHGQPIELTGNHD